MSTHSYMEFQLHDFKTDLHEPIDLFNISNCNRRIKSYRYQPFYNRKEIFPAVIDFYEEDNQIFTLVSSCLKVGLEASIYLFKVNNKNTGKRCEICTNLTIKTLERRQYVVLVFLF